MGVNKVHSRKSFLNISMTMITGVTGVDKIAHQGGRAREERRPGSKRLRY